MVLFQLGRYERAEGLEDEASRRVVVVSGEELSHAQVQPAAFEYALHERAHAPLFHLDFDHEWLHVFDVFLKQLAVDALQRVDQLPKNVVFVYFNICLL